MIEPLLFNGSSSALRNVERLQLRPWVARERHGNQHRVEAIQREQHLLLNIGVGKVDVKHKIEWLTNVVPSCITQPGRDVLSGKELPKPRFDLCPARRQDTAEYPELSSSPVS